MVKGKTYLKEARMMAGYTQKQVSEETGIPLGTLRRWEQGQNEPDIDGLKALASLYGRTVDALLFGRDQMVDEIRRQPERAGSLLLDYFGGSNDLGRSLILDYAAFVCAKHPKNQDDSAGACDVQEVTQWGA